MPCWASLMNEFSLACSLSAHVACRARYRNVVNAIRLGRKVHPPARLQDTRALTQVAQRVCDVLDDRVRQHDVEAAVRERERLAVGLQESQIRDAAFGCQTRSRVLE